MQLDDHYIKFKFSSVMSRKYDRPFEVYAKNMDEMNMFLNQHCFKNVDNSAFEIIPTSMCRNKNDMMLRIYSFKSNHSNDVYRVMTTRSFVDMAAENTASIINCNLLFGEAILRHDIEIFKHINDLLWDLPHVHVKDVLLADDDIINSNNLIKETIEMRSQYLSCIDKPWNDYDPMLVAQSLYDAISDDDDPDEIYPITIEAYVSNFTSMITDTCNT